MDRFHKISVLALAILSISVGWEAFATPAPSTNTIVTPGSFFKDCDYVTYQDGSTILSTDKTGDNIASSTNATSVIQTTLNLLSSGGRLCLSLGTYNLDHGLTIQNSNVQFAGRGIGTKLTFTNAATKDNLLTIGLGNAAFILPQTVTGYISNVTVSNLWFDGRKTVSDTALNGGAGFEGQNMGIFVLGSKYVTISGVTVQHTGQYGIYFRATRTTFTPSSTNPQPLLYNTVINSNAFDEENGIYYDGVATGPSDTSGRGNRVVASTAVQDWNTMNIDVASNNQGRGMEDFGDIGTVFTGNHVEGYTPNPGTPGDSNFAGMSLDGNSSAIVTSTSIFNSYQGINFNPSGSPSGASQAAIDDLYTYQVRYSIDITGVTKDVTVNSLLFADPMDTVGSGSGFGVFIGAKITRLYVRNLDGLTDGAHPAVGNSGMMQIAGSITAPVFVETIGGALNNLGASFSLSTFPTTFIIQDVAGYNPQNKIALPFTTSPAIMSPLGANAAPTASTTYTVEGVSIYNFTSSGGTGVVFTIKDSAGNCLICGAAVVTNAFLAIGDTVSFGAFSVAPTVKVYGN